MNGNDTHPQGKSAMPVIDVNEPQEPAENAAPVRGGIVARTGGLDR